ncbi:hypothetical protein HX875_22265 [Pseudomonas yamanorum]|jgi:hypothetical protein|uniref:Uncharacterized protein n=1 Tax=Pseudomonas yamanorum TaxID=515393 RepID=A0A7Y8K454_9PSED|nr:hypothetical protein [Pseudomonas yamanorum]NVZ82615.1 hypothetical protein [Pseudomonas yamanorum]NWD23971.1 hypothetical protein [Pseudomonas yamanorum]NWE11740.1 hypothetical protein [Pseudomonas yamanorum]NWE42218.1 hypothetical protein [Pseudomonas yamanorum]NWE75463.1 hypothetical protein [Pseudomonas yamanorum]
MLSIGANNPAIVSSLNVPDAKKDTAVDDKDKASATDSAAGTKPQGLVVDISGAGLKAAKASTNSNKDIDDSNLKENIKQLLKMIRELRKQLAEKQAQLSAAMADTSMSPQARRAKVASLQSDVASLQSGLMMAQSQLTKSLKDESPESQMEAMALLAK